MSPQTTFCQSNLYQHPSPTLYMKNHPFMERKGNKINNEKLQIHKIKINENERMSFISNFTHIETISFIASGAKMRS